MADQKADSKNAGPQEVVVSLHGHLFDAEPAQQVETRIQKRAAEVVEAYHALEKVNGELRQVITQLEGHLRERAADLLRAHQTLEAESLQRRQAEEQLRASEERYQTVTSFTYDWEYWVSPNSTILYMSPSSEILTGYPPEEYVQDPRMLTEIVHPDDRRAFEDHLCLVVDPSREEGVHEMDFRIRRRDGEVRWIAHACKPIYRPDGTYLGRRASNRDITERKRLDHVLTFLAQTSGGAAEGSFFNALAPYLAECLEMDFVCIDRLEGDGLSARTLAVWSDGHFADNMTYCLKDTPCDKVVGKMVCCFPSGVRQAFPFAATLQALQAESYVGATLWSHAGKPIGLIGVVGRTPLRNPSLAEATLKIVAVRAAAELERLDAEAALRERTERYELVVAGSLAAIWDWDVANKRILFSRQWKQLRGYLEDEISDREEEWTRHIHPEDVTQVLAAVQEHFDGKVPVFAAEYRICCKDGSWKWVMNRGIAMRDEAGRVVRMAGAEIDTTERKQTETILVTRLSLESLYEQASLDQLIQASLDSAEALTGSKIGFFHFVDEDQENLTLQTWSTNTTRNMCTAEGKGHHYPVKQAGVWVVCVAAGRPVIHNDYASLPHKKGLPPGHAPVIRELTVPILRNGVVLAIMGVGNKPTEYTENDVKVVQELLSHLMDMVARKRAEEQLRKLSMAVEQSPATVVITDPSGTIEYVNSRFTETTGYARDEVLGKNLRLLKSGETSEQEYKELWETITAGGEWRGLFHNKRKDGTLFWESAFISPIRDASGAISHFLGIEEDITQQKTLEDQLRQAQKMEAIGQLAGGVAHDFNNLLQVIVGNLDVAMKDIAQNNSGTQAIEEVRQAAERAVDLTRQLLAFSRRQVIQPVNLDLNQLVHKILKMIRRVIGENIELRFLAAGQLGTVRADKGQMEQILMNLCVNARDAMPNGGKLIVETENVVIDDAYCRENTGAKEGRCVLLSVTDTGMGMDEATRTRVFEPFFTTKTVGKGTGLGLATVYGIVQQHNGMIQVSSELGKGTSFKIYLPVVEEAAESIGNKAEAPVKGGTETILLAEDEEALRKVVVRMLKSAGYTVLSAHDGEEALRVFEEHKSEIRLAVLDVIMPKLGGREVMDRIRAANPDMRFLFSSGYSEGAIGDGFVLKDGLHLITKPYSQDDLLRFVREILDS